MDRLLKYQCICSPVCVLLMMLYFNYAEQKWVLGLLGLKLFLSEIPAVVSSTYTKTNLTVSGAVGTCNDIQDEKGQQREASARRLAELKGHRPWLQRSTLMGFDGG